MKRGESMFLMGIGLGILWVILVTLVTIIKLNEEDKDE